MIKDELELLDLRSDAGQEAMRISLLGAATAKLTELEALPPTPFGQSKPIFDTSQFRPMRGRKLPPFARHLMFFGWHISTVCIGAQAWQDCRKLRKAGRFATLLPPGSHPGGFNWTWAAGAVVALHRGVDVTDDDCMTLAIELLRAGARRVWDGHGNRWRAN